MDKTHVLVVDDHALVRQGIVDFIRQYGDLQVIAEASNGREALARVEELRPDIVLMDLMMPEMDGVSATRAIRARYPEVRVLILTSFGETEHVRAALQAGASGYLLKDASAAELANAVRAARRGELPLTLQVMRTLVEDSRSPYREESTRLSALSEREREVLVLLARGMGNKEIATHLSISDKTVKFHVSSILGKLDVIDRTQAALFAARHGLAPPN